MTDKAGQGAGTRRQGGSWVSQPNETPQSQPGGQNSSGPAVSPQQTIPDDDSPSQPVGTSSSPPNVGPAISAGSFFQGKAETAQSVGGPPNVGLVSGASQTTLSKGSSIPGEPEPTGPVASSAPDVEANIGTGKEAGELTGAGNNSSIGSAASSPPAQLLAALDAYGGVSTHLLSPADAFTGRASGPGSHATTGPSGSAYTGGSGKMPASDASTSRSDLRLQELPGPKEHRPDHECVSV